MIEYKEFLGLPPENIVEELVSLDLRVFGDSFILSEIHTKQHLITYVAYKNDRIIGYKMGHEAKTWPFS